MPVCATNQEGPYETTNDTEEQDEEEEEIKEEKEDDLMLESFQCPFNLFVCFDHYL